jgi:hypothetical protein
MNKLYVIIGILVISPVFLLGSFLLIKGVRNIQMSLASVHWPKAAGMVVSSVTTRTAPTQERTLRPMGEGPGLPDYATFGTTTKIGYTVNGREYTTNLLHFGQTLGSSDRSDAALLSLRYPAGKEVPVSYNPSSPSVAVMNPGLHSEAFWLPSAGLAFLVPVALLMLLWPSIFGGPGKNDQTFESYTKSSIAAMQEAAKSGRRVSLPDSPPPQFGGSENKIMGVAAGLFAAVFCGLGVLALTVGIQRAWKGYASQNWPIAPGVVVWAIKSGGPNGADLEDTSDEPGHVARFVYQYEVAGKKHYNNIRRFEEISGGADKDMERIAHRYRKGAKVDVRYFPADPDVSNVEPGNTSSVFILPGIGIAALLVGLATFRWIVPAMAKSF